MAYVFLNPPTHPSSHPTIQLPIPCDPSFGGLAKARLYGPKSWGTRFDIWCARFGVDSLSNLAQIHLSISLLVDWNTTRRREVFTSSFHSFTVFGLFFLRIWWPICRPSQEMYPHSPPNWSLAFSACIYGQKMLRHKHDNKTKCDKFAPIAHVASSKWQVATGIWQGALYSWVCWQRSLIPMGHIIVIQNKICMHEYCLAYAQLEAGGECGRLKGKAEARHGGAGQLQCKNNCILDGAKVYFYASDDKLLGGVSGSGYSEYQIRWQSIVNKRLRSRDCRLV